MPRNEPDGPDCRHCHGEPACRCWQRRWRWSRACEPAHGRKARRPFDQWVATFRARARARGISDATYTRVMGGLKPDTAVFELNRAQPEFNEQLWQYLNRRVSDWRIVTGKEKAKEYAPLLARIEKDYGVDRSVMLGLVGHRIGLRRSGRAAEPHAPGHSGARRARLGRAAPARLLGAGIAQRAGHHRARLGHARGDERLLGRRHGPHPMDAGGVAQCRRRLRRRRPRLAVRPARRRARPAPRAIWSSAASTGRASIGATRCAARRARGEGASRSYDAWQKAGVTRADGKPFPQPERDGEALGAGAGRPGLPARPELLCRALLQSVDELHALDRPSRRPRPGRRTVRAALPGRRAHADARRGAGDPAAPDRARLRHRRHRRPRRQRHHDRGAQFPAQGRHGSRPTAMPG